MSEIDASVRPHARGTRLKLLLAFMAIYLVWGSTFFAIRVAIAGMPPFLMCGVRLLLAGVMMLVWAWRSGSAWPRGVEWRNAALVGLMLPAAGNGLVTLAESHVPSGLVALLMGSIPMWMALMAAVGPERSALRPRVSFGLVLGVAGIALLVGPGAIPGATPSAWGWSALPVLGAMSWAYGSLWSRRVPMPASPLASTAVGLTAGGVLLIAIGMGVGEPARVTAAAFQPAPVAALLYLAVFGSVVGFTAYLWLLQRVSPTLVSTYAFVNPVVAMLLGFAFAGEPFGARTLVAALLVLIAVALIVTAPAPTVRPSAQFQPRGPLPGLTKS